MPLSLLTADEKINELQQLLEIKSLEGDEIRVEMEQMQAKMERGGGNQYVG